MYYQQQPQFNNFGGAVYQQHVDVPKMTQPLTKEEIAELRKKSSGFTLQIPKIEFIRAACTHKDNGIISLIENSDGSCTCKLCSETFYLLKCSDEEAQEIVNRFLDLFQSIKTMYLDIPEVYVKEICNMIPIVKKIPELYSIAIKSFERYENGVMGLNSRGGARGFALLNNIMSPYQANPMMGGMMPQQPMYANNGMMPQQPMYANNGMIPQQQPMYATNGGLSNGFGYNYEQVPQQQVQQPITQPPIVNQSAQNTNQQVVGGSGVPYTKNNATTTNGVTTEKVFNN